MARKPLTREQLLSALAAAPLQIADITAGLTQAQLHAAPRPDEWSANELLAHLRACADVWGSCMTTILAEDRPTIRAVNPTTWITRTDYCEQSFRPSLQAFTEQRTKLLAVLEPLTQGDWERWATVTGAGKALQRSVGFYAQWLATHERPHLKQFYRIAETLRE